MASDNVLKKLNTKSHEDDGSSSSDSEDSFVSAPGLIIVARQRSASIIPPEIDDESNSDEDEEESSSPENLRYPSWLVNIYTYCFIVSLISGVYYFYLAYTVAAMTSIEKRYGWPSIFSGLFLASFEIGHFTIIVFSFTETNVHIPRRLAIRGIFMAFGSLLAAAPHFLITVPSNLTSVKFLNETHPMEQFYCLNVTANCDNSTTLTDQTSSRADDDSTAITALILLIVAQLVVAVASSTYHVVSVVYIDNNVHKSKSSFLIGFVYGMMMLGPAAAFFFSSFVSESIYVNPSEPNPPHQNSPQFVGAWWVGFVFCAVCFAVTAPLLFLFPHSLIKKTGRKHRRSALHDVSRSNSVTRTGNSPVDVGNEEFTIASIPRNFVILFRNTVFIALAFVSCMQVYFLAGYFTFFPKYLESKFGQSTAAANFISGISNPVPCALGTFLGGWLMSKLKPSQSETLVYSFVFTLLTAVGLLFLSLLECDNGEVYGISTTNATQYCGCEYCPKSYEPVCLDNRFTFVTPCQAGCKLGNGTHFFDCGCSFGNLSLTQATPGQCGERDGSMPRCANFYIYNVASFLLAVAIFIPQTPLTIIMMRVVGERYKSWSVGLTSSFCSLLGFIPAPVIYGAVIDSLCLYWEESGPSPADHQTCLSESPSGISHCAVYDQKGLSIWFHSLTSIFLFASLPVNIYAWWKCRKQEQQSENKA